MKNFKPVAILSLSALCFPFLLLLGCGSNGIESTVSAQQNYSTASLNGTYSVNESGITNGVMHSGTGTLQFDGKGNLTGKITDYYVGSNPCEFSIAGTYTLSSSAAGTVNETSTTTDPNCVGSTGTVNIQVGQQGEALTFAETDGLRLNAGTALKQ